MGSSITLLSLAACDCLKLKGEPFSLKLSGVMDAKCIIDSRFVDFDIESVDSKIFSAHI